MSAPQYPRVAALKTAEAFRRHLHACGAALEFDDTLDIGGKHLVAEAQDTLFVARMDF